MKNRLLTYHAAFIVTTFLTGVSVLSNNSVWITVGLLAISFIIGCVIFKNWTDYIFHLLNKSDQTLNQKSERKITQWANDLEKLEQNQNKIAQKINLSANLISNLSHPEKFEKIDDLIANDPIGKALQHIRSEMKSLKDEDEKQAWVTGGLAQFSNILRNKGEVKEYGYSIISNLVKYLKANQGGLYIEYKDGGERYLELIACYAYDKRKYVEKKIFEGQGIVGQCMLEQDFTFITDVPKDYVKITSGLGEATPRNIIVAPLIFNETFCGVIELASFEVLQAHQVEFLKKVCENIASEIATIKTVSNTKQLLEESKILTEELQTREEEMKQNLEELAATQEEMSRKQAELSGIINAIDSTLATVELNMEGKITKYNSILENFLGLTNKSLVNKDYRLITGNDNPTLTWNDISSGKIKSGEFRVITLAGEEVWLSITFTPILNSAGTTVKLLSMLQDITQRKLKEKEAERKQSELNSYLGGINNTIASAEFDMNGDFKDGNEIFMKVMGFSKEELDKKGFDFLMGDDQSIIMMWENLRLGKFFSGEFKMKNKIGKELWLTGTFNPITIEIESPEKVMMFAQFTTQEKEKLNDLQAMVQALKVTLPVIEFNADFACKTANEKAMKLLGLSRLELRSKTILNFLSTYYHGMWEKTKQEILKNNHSSLLLPFGEENRMMNYEVSISINNNVDGSIAKIIVLLVKEVHDRVPVLVAI